MMGISLGHLIVVAIVVLLFGSRRIPELGGAVGKGIRSFKNGLAGITDESIEPQNHIEEKDSNKTA